MRYTVIDCETTGVFNKDRIVEIGIISFDVSGQIIETFDTLINPKRDIRSGVPHNISATMVKGAPTFNQIMGDILELINGSIIVAHNFRFDVRMLSNEFNRYSIELEDIHGICTLDLSKAVLQDVGSRKLKTLCEIFNIPLLNAHSALDDSIATKELFISLYNEYVKLHDEETFINRYIRNKEVVINAIPYNRSYIQFKREDSERSVKEEQNKLQRMVKQLEDINEYDAPVLEYLNVLEMILIDRNVTDEEVEFLSELITDYKISRENALEIHEKYLRNLVGQYLSDGVIDKAEQKDLEHVASLLGITNRLNQIISLEKFDLLKNKGISPKWEKRNVSSRFEGQLICFTGNLQCTLEGERISKEKAISLVEQKRMIGTNSWTKDVDLLVAADPNSMSGKAEKARKKGIPIIGEHQFWAMMGIKVD